MDQGNSRISLVHKLTALQIIATTKSVDQPESPFLGLAPFLRSSLAGKDLRPICEEMLAAAGNRSGDGNLWMNLATVLFCLNQRDTGLAVQAEALSMQRVYRLSAAQQPAKLRLLVLVASGDLTANTPIDCLLENTDFELILYYCASPTALADPVPEHDVLMVAISESDANRDLLSLLQSALHNWPRPIINAPQNIPAVERNMAAKLLQDIPGLLMPPTSRAIRSDLVDIAAGDTRLAKFFPGCDFPLILRPVGSHAGRDLERIDSLGELAVYLEKANFEEFYLSLFIDYSSRDRLFRKFRIVLIDGEAFVCHMAISTNWMIHYVNAGMYEDAKKRAEEADFMASFDNFSARHRLALKAIYRRAKLDYLCIDCAETRDGQLLIFEIDHAMVVHAMDSEELFPQKQHHMHKVRTAFRNYCLRLSAAKHSKQAL